MLWRFVDAERTHSREIALQAIYQLEIRGNEVIDEIDTFAGNKVKKPK